MGRAAKSYTYDSGAVRLVYKAAGSEQKVYMEASSNGTAVAASNSRRQQNLVGILFCMLPVNAWSNVLDFSELEKFIFRDQEKKWSLEACETY